MRCCPVLAALYLLQLLKTHVDNLKKRRRDQHFVQKVALKFIWLLCTGRSNLLNVRVLHFVSMFPYLFSARNALVVFVAALIGYCLTLQPWFNGQISLIDYNHGSLPPLKVPDPTSGICSVNSHGYAW